jgi:hypothetical protein
MKATTGIPRLERRFDHAEDVQGEGAFARSDLLL